MNKKIKTSLLSILLMIISLFSNLTFVYANENKELSKEQIEEIQDSVQIIPEVMYILKQVYIDDTNVYDLVNSALKGITDSLDEYTHYYSKEEFDKFISVLSDEQYGLGILYKQDQNDYPIVQEVLKDSPAFKAGILEGDKIKSINGIELKEKNFLEVNDELISKKIVDVNLEIIRDKSELKLKLKFDKYEIRVAESKKLTELLNIENIDNSVGYIKLSSISENSFKQFKEEVDKLKQMSKTKLILDLRGNTGGIVKEAVEIAKMLVPKGIVFTIKDRFNNVTEYKSTLETLPFEKIAVLVNETTASAAEMIASAIQDSKAGFIVGQKSFGKGVIQDLIQLENGSVLKVTTHEFFTRNGSKINGIGITPDLEIKNLLYLDISDDANNKHFNEVISKLGFKITETNTIENIIKNFQKENNLRITGSLNGATIRAFNEQIYLYNLNNNEALKVAYDELIK